MREHIIWFAEEIYGNYTIKWLAKNMWNPEKTIGFSLTLKNQIRHGLWYKTHWKILVCI